MSSTPTLAQEGESAGSSCDSSLRFMVQARTSHGTVELYQCISGDGMSDMSGVVCGLDTVLGFGTVPGWTDLEVLATTAHGVLYLRKDSSGFFVIHHVLHDGTVQWVCNGTVWPGDSNPRHSDEDFARQGAAEFLVRWKKEFALEHLAYSLAQSATDG